VLIPSPSITRPHRGRVSRMSLLSVHNSVMLGGMW
jgi:hypothetical protein